MATETPLNKDQVQQKFEGIIEHGEGANFLQQSDVDERFGATVNSLLGLIDKNTYLEEGKEKETLKLAVLKQLIVGLNSVDTRLEEILRTQGTETAELRQRLYEKSVTMVTELGGAVGRQIEKAADYYHIDDTEFKTEVLGQVPYMISGIPAMDYVAKKRAAEGNSPQAAMQSAATQYLGAHPNVFDRDLVAKRYPGLTLPEQTFACARIVAPENLRDPATSKVVRSAAVGEVFQVLATLPPQGKYTYELVLDKRGNTYKLCTNDGSHVLPLEYSKGKYHPPESAAAGVDVSTLTEPLRTVVENGYATADGTLTSFVNPLRIDQVLPASVMRASIVFNQKMNGAGIPQGTSVTIVREGGTFVFEGQYAGLGRSDGRVRVYEGDQVQLAALPAPEKDAGDTGSLSDTGEARDTGDAGDTGEIMDRNHHEIPYSVSAYWNWMRTDWQAPNVLPPEQQEKPACAGYVQRLLEGLYGHDFAKEVFIEDGHFVDAWMLAGRIENSGYGHIAIDLSGHFIVDKTQAKISADESTPGYGNDIQRLMRLAASPQSKTGVIFMHYKHTAANPDIIANLDNGGSLNSHAMLILGPEIRSFNAPKADASLASSVIASMKTRLGESYDNSWEKNRYLLATLRDMKVNGVPVAFSEGEFRDAERNVVGVQTGDKITYTDTQVTDFYHNKSRPTTSPARTVGLTEIMIQGNLDPVKLAQWDQAVVDSRTPEVGQGFIVGEFRLDASVTNFPAAILEHYEAQGQADPSFRARNPDANVYLKRSLDFFRRVHVINEPDALPIVGARIPILDWSKKPERPPKPKVEKPKGTFAELSEKASDFYSRATS